MKRFISFLLVVCMAVTMLTTGAWAADGPDAVYYNGKVVTVDADFSVAEAFAVQDGKFVAVGTNEAVKALAGTNTKLVDLGGKTVMPGLYDSHLHFMRYGLKFLQINCTDKSKEAILSEVKEKAEALGNTELWVRGNGWNQELWTNNAFPTKEDLDAVVKDNPVALIRSDNHTLWVNSKALELAGITKDTKDPDGGVIQRDASGNPNGILVDAAMGLVNAIIPAWSEEEKVMAYLAADKSYSQLGITTVDDAGDEIDIPLLKRLIGEGQVNTRVYAVLDKTKADQFLEAKTPAVSGLLDNHLSIRAIKLKADGALGSRGAKLMTDYSDKPGETGNTLISKEELAQYAEKALELGYQLHIHAIGDKTSRDALDVIEATVKSGKNPNNEQRFSVVHAQVESLSDIPRYGELNVPALMQPIHATGDMSMAETRVGAWRILGAYAWRSITDAGAIVAAGSDSPNDYLSPMYGIHAFVTRQNRDNLPTGGWYPQECLTLEEAIQAYTINGAYVNFEEDLKGSIEEGKLADFIILSDDILTINPQDIHTIEIENTFIGGKEVYAKP